MSTVRPSLVTIDFEGKAIEARATDTIAAALLRDGVQTFSRGAKYHRPRGPFCLTGNCAQCHMRVGDEPNVATCVTPVQAGLHVERQNVLGTGDHDLLRAVDFLYPEGIDHHHLMTRFKLLNEATKHIARRLAGIGTVPTVPAKAPPVRVVRRPLVIVGAGPAGLAAAREATQDGVAPLVLDSRGTVGGHVAEGFARPGDPALADMETWGEEVVKAGGQVVLNAHVAGLYAEAGSHILIAIVGQQIWQVEADRVLVATGGQERNLSFEANDLPGVFSGRGLVRLAREHGVVPGTRAVIVASHADASRVATELRARRVEIVAIVDSKELLPTTDRGPTLRGATALSALGHGSVAGLRVRTAQGTERELECDLIAVVAPPVPCYELTAEVGASTRFSPNDGGFVVVSDGQGRTNVDWLFVAGRVAGESQDPVESGRRAAKSATAALAPQR